jgi:hypothetical protein
MLAGLVCLPGGGLRGDDGSREARQGPAVLIRPANYDPDDEHEYTRLRGELAPGRRADLAVWNRSSQSRQNSQAAVSGDADDPAPTPGAGSPVSAASGASEARLSYTEAYNLVPFSRSEYEANPGYRHEAALEIMMGAMRPMTVVRQSLPYFSRYPDMFRNRYSVFPYPDSGSGPIDLYHHWRTSVIAW